MLTNKLECGKLRHRIQIVAPSGTQDSFGGVNAANPAQWTTVQTCWSSINSLTARDLAAAGTFVSNVSHRIVIRNPREAATIGPNQQVWFEGRVFIIQAVQNPDETNKMLYLMCLEVVVNTPAAPNASTDR
jgi:SPP1 family predicted phage head-tail adaptor